MIGTRVGLLAGLLVLAMGSGVVSQSPSPEATPLYAPADIGSAVPYRVGSVDLRIQAMGAGDYGLGSDPGDRAHWRDFLTAWGKEPTDMVVAYGVDSASASDPALAVWALRVVDVAADELIEPTLVTSDTDLSDIPPGGHADWRDIEGRRVLVLTADDSDDWRAYYPHGEVLFVAYGDDRVAVEDVVLALRTGETAAQSPSPEPPPWFGGRVEMPEHGFAVTLPDDWVAFDTAVDAVDQLEAASGVLDPTVWPVDGVLQQWTASISQGIQLWSVHATSLDHCLFAAAPVSAWPVEDIADDLFDRYVDDPVGYDVEPLQSIDLPAGPAYVVRFSGETPGVGVWWSSTYLLAMGEGAFAAVCITYDHPENDWLSIAETFEFLPAEE